MFYQLVLIYLDFYKVFSIFDNSKICVTFLFEIIASFIPENNTPLIKEDLPAPKLHNKQSTVV